MLSKKILNMKAKPIILIVLTLLIGFFLGILTSAQLRHRKMKSVRVFSSERYFKDIVYRVTNPDEDQIKKLEPIFKRFGKEGMTIQKNFRSEFDKNNAKYWEEIRSVLTDDQIKLLDDMDRRHRYEMRQFRQDTTRRGRGDWEGRPRGGDEGRGRSNQNQRQRSRLKGDSLQQPITRS